MTGLFVFLIAVALLVLTVVTALSWVQAFQEGGRLPHLAGAIATTTLTIAGYWFVFFSGVVQL